MPMGMIRRSRQMWTNENRGRYDRSKLRYPSDVTDEEWGLLAPLIPPAKRGGNKRTVIEREIVNGLMYILSTGCQWASLPKDLPPRSTVNDYFRRWDHDGTLDQPAFNRDRLNAEKLIDSISLEQLSASNWTRVALDRIHHALYVQCREKAGREASPTAAIIDSQSVKNAEKGGVGSIRAASMRARRSRARSAMSW